MSIDQTTVWVGLALLFAAYVKGVSGMGFPLIATPTVALLLDIRTAVTILIIPNIVMDITQVFRGEFPLAIFRRFSGLLLLTIVGVFIGTKVLVTLPIWVLNLTLGTIVLIFIASQMLRLDFKIPARWESVVSPVMGLIGGFLNGMTNAAGPALAIYLYGLRLPKMEFIKSIASIFIVTKLSQLAAVSSWNLLNRSTLRLSLAVTAFILIGFYAGLKTQDRVNQQIFNRGLLILLFIISIALIVHSLR
jgi:uncharacterized membrane protein YfcA